ncbi:hypothetical protein Acr_05g0016010 [Actinidia rufa]|uniref:Transposase (putative) gypsy type domain-containing protein n=1 Tax=Actinidia rufa TaxID=165716 RepID=A0A7J0ENR1_9ERIC|nr:hypothetical protein Acr_05g0016010 [Actinidia rufa]
MIAGKRAHRRVVEYVERTFERWGSGLFIDGVMGRVHGSRRDPRKDERESHDGHKDRNLVEINQAKYSTSPNGEEETTLWLWASSVEIAWRGPTLNVGLVLPRSGGFQDKHPLERSWATSSVMVLGRRSCLSGKFYPTSVAPYSKCRGGLRDLRVRLPDEGEIITSTCPGEVAFYEAAFPAGLRFPLHPTIRLILQFYNICPTQLIPNAWRSIACSMALWRVYKYSISLSEFRNLFSLNSNPKPDQGWLYFKARNKKVLLGGYPSNVKGWKSKFFFISGDEWEIPEGTPREGVPRVPRTWGILGDNLPSKEAPSSSSDVGESQNPHEQARRESPSRDDSIECLGSIRTELRRLLPHIPDLTLLRWTGGKVLDPILDRFLNAPSSNPSSESCSDLSLPVELESDDRREAWKDGGCELGDSCSGKGVVIGEKQAGESITSSPSKKGKADDDSKGKGVDSGPEGKKKVTSSSKASAAPTAVPSRPGEGTSAHLSTVPGPTPSILGIPSVAERLLRGVIPLADKEKVEKLTLDQTATKLFHVIGQALVLGSSLAVRSREAGEQASLQEGRVASMETEVACLQKLAADLEQQLAESRAREQQANDELAKMKSDRGLLTDKLERSGLLVNELREALDKAKESAVEEFKSSLEFMVAVEDSASKYFGKGFDFYKVQLRRHHPNLAIDVEGTVVDQDLLAEQDEATEEREKENLGENKGCGFSYDFNVNGDHALGDENSLGDAKLATSLTAIRTPIILE